MKAVAEEIKTAGTKFPVMDVIKERWSARSFSPASIAKEDMSAIMEAASWAPSAMNDQPWGYVVALKENKEGFRMLLDCLNPGNAAWAKDAAALVFCYAKLTYSNGNNNASAMHDTGMANMNLLLQAKHMNIYSHIIGGYDKQKAADDFGLTDDYAPVCMIALGYLGDPSALEEPFRTREVTPRSRKPLTDFVTWI